MKPCSLKSSVLCKIPESWQRLLQQELQLSSAPLRRFQRWILGPFKNKKQLHYFSYSVDWQLMWRLNRIWNIFEQALSCWAKRRELKERTETPAVVAWCLEWLWISQRCCRISYRTIQVCSYSISGFPFKAPCPKLPFISVNWASSKDWPFNPSSNLAKVSLLVLKALNLVRQTGDPGTERLNVLFSVDKWVKWAQSDINKHTTRCRTNSQSWRRRTRKIQHLKGSRLDTVFSCRHWRCLVPWRVSSVTDISTSNLSRKDIKC